MASSRLSSNGPDWKDVVVFLLEIQRDLNCKVEIVLRPAGTPGRPALDLEATALAVDTNQLVVRVLASAKLHLPGNNLGGLEAALYSLGHELDKDAYRRGTGMGPKTA